MTSPTLNTANSESEYATNQKQSHLPFGVKKSINVRHVLFHVMLLVYKNLFRQNK